MWSKSVKTSTPSFLNSKLAVPDLDVWHPTRFSLSRDKISELIDYIIEMPTEDEHKRGHKYPFVAAEIFNAEVMAIID